MGDTVAPDGDGEPRCGEHVFDQLAGSLEIAGHKVEHLGAGELVEDQLLGVAEELRQDPVRHYAGKMNRRFAGEPGGQVDRFVHGHLLGRGDKHGPCPGRVTEDLEYPVGLGPDDAHPDQLVDAARRRQLADDVACGGGVDNDEVVAAGRGSRNTSLPTVRISLIPGAAVATKSKARATGPMWPMVGTFATTRRYSRNDASVSMDIATRSSLMRRPLKGVGPHS